MLLHGSLKELSTQRGTLASRQGIGIKMTNQDKKMPEEISVWRGVSSGKLYVGQRPEMPNENLIEYVRKDLTEPSPQPPTDNDHVAEGCEQFSKPTSRPLAVFIKELEDNGCKPDLDKAREEIKAVIDDGLRGAVKSQYWIMGTSVYRTGQRSHETPICTCETVNQAHAIREEIITHAIKTREEVAEVTVKEFEEYMLLSCTDSYQEDAEVLAKKYPAGIKIIDGEKI